jgi:hypothetical protein
MVREAGSVRLHFRGPTVIRTPRCLLRHWRVWEANKGSSVHRLFGSAARLRGPLKNRIVPTKNGKWNIRMNIAIPIHGFHHGED